MTFPAVVRSMAVGVVLAVSGSAAHADVISFSDSFGNLAADVLDEPLRVHLFDSSQGTLNRVVVTMSGDLASTGSVTNTAATPQTFSVRTEGGLYEGFRAAGSPAALPNPFEVLSGVVIHSQSFVNLAAGANAAFGPGNVASGLLTVLDTTNPAELAQFVGLGDFGYDMTSLTGILIVGGGGNVMTSIETVAGATLTVEYDFTRAQVPIPATLPLMALGLAGLAFTRRRKTPL